MRTMRTRTMILTLLALIFGTTAIDAQVTIGNDTPPQTTLDVVASKTDGTTAEGIMAPRLTLAQLKAADTQYTAAQTGALVYVTDATGGTTTKTVNVTAAGYYYFDGTLWHSVSGVDNNTLYDISYESSTSLLTLTPTTGDGSPVAIPLPKDTASNGLTKNGNNVQLGGTLTKATAIAQGSNALTFSGTGKTIVSSPLQYNNTAAAPAANKVLTSDASGNATWQFPALPMIMGSETGNNQVINMADYIFIPTLISNAVEVPFVSFTLPPGKWLIFYYVPFQFNFTNASISQVSFLMSFVQVGISNVNMLTMFNNGTVVNNAIYRNAMMEIIDNTTSGNLKYTLRVGNFQALDNSGNGVTPLGNITIVPAGYGCRLYAIGVK